METIPIILAWDDFVFLSPAENFPGGFANPYHVLHRVNIDNDSIARSTKVNAHDRKTGMKLKSWNPEAKRPTSAKIMLMI
jgi:hypothetical protein